MKKLYHSPELEIVKFAAMEAMAATGFEGSDPDINETLDSDEE